MCGGGPNLTPPTDSIFELWSGYVLASLFGSSTARFRYKKKLNEHPADELNLISCNLAIRHRVFQETGLFFDEKCSSNEENILLFQLKEKGHKMILSPDLIVYHRRRDNLLEFSKQIYKYGKGRMQQTIKFPKSLPAWVALPSLFVFYLASLFFAKNAFYALPIFIYLFLDTAHATFYGLKFRSFKSFALLLILFPVHHLSYGAGFLAGLNYLVFREQEN